MCTRVNGPTAIHLGLSLPAASCGLPASIGRAALKRSRRKLALPFWPCSRWGLPSHPSRLGCWWSLTPPFHPYLPRLGRGGGLFSVALSRGSPRVGVTDHPALRSPDLPRRCDTARPPGRLARQDKDIRFRPPPAWVILSPPSGVPYASTRSRQSEGEDSEQDHQGRYRPSGCGHAGCHTRGLWFGTARIPAGGQRWRHIACLDTRKLAHQFRVNSRRE
jgi:hypothetical protein